MKTALIFTIGLVLCFAATSNLFGQINDQCDGAIVITGTGYTNSQPTTMASSVGDPVVPCAALGKGVWYKYTPTANGQVFVDTAGSDFNSALAAYAGSCDALTYLACDDNSGGNYNA